MTPLGILARIGIVAWVVATFVLGGLLLVPHLAALPTPLRTDARLAAAVDALPSTPGHWRAVHFLYRKCTCSQRTLDHLVAGGRPAGVDERVIMIDDDARPGAADARLRAAGFAVEIIAPRELSARFGLEAAPVLVFVRPDGSVAYVGGYNRHKQSPAFEDLAIFDELRHDEAPAALPVFGCPTSARLAHALDPLGLRR